MKGMLVAALVLAASAVVQHERKPFEPARHQLASVSSNRPLRQNR